MVRVDVQSVSDVTTGQMAKRLRESRLVSALSRRASTRELSGSQSPLLTLHCMFIVQAWKFQGSAEPFHWSPHSQMDLF